MTPARWHQIQELLNGALAIPAPERARFVAVACHGDTDLQRDVDSLLEQASAASDFLSTTITNPRVTTARPIATLVGKQLGPYHVKSRLGGGGMGEVYLAEDTRLHRLVALKALHEDRAATPQGRERVLREARAVAALNHPHIAAIYDVLETPDNPETPPYIVMEYVEGETLSDRLRTGALAVEDALRLGREIATALAAAHKRGIIHRDLKPANLRLTVDGGVKVLDFGLARMTSASPDAPTETLDRPLVSHGGHGVAGTPGYMSPEQALGHEATPASDVFSFGVVLFQMLTGRRPFKGDDFLSAALAMIGSPVPRIAEIVPGVPVGVDAVVTRMLGKDPAERPTAEEVRAELAKLSTQTHATDSAQLSDRWRRGSAPLTWRRIGVYGTLVGVVGVLVAPSVRPIGKSLGIINVGTPPPTVLAILPIDTPGGDQRAGFLGAAIASVVAGNFGSIQRVTVIPVPASASYLKTDDFVALQRAIGATHVLRLRWRSTDPLRLAVSVYTPGVAAPQWDETFQGAATAIEQNVLAGLARTLERARDGRFTNDERTRLRRVPTTNGTALMAYAEAAALLNTPGPDESRPVALLQQAVALDPQFVLAWAALGEAWWQKFQRDKDRALVANADEALRRALALDPDAAQVHYALGDMQYRTGQPTQAEGSFRRALQLQPDYGSAQRGLAQILAASGRIGEAEAVLNDAIRFSTNWNNFFMLGTIEYRAGNYDAAADAFRRATDANPTNSGAFTMLGISQYILGNFQQAVGNLEHAVRLGPSAAAHANLALAYYDAGRFDDALHSYERSLDMDPRNPVNHRNIGDVERRLGHADRSRTHYERAITISNELLSVNPRDARIIALVALCEAKLGRQSDADRHAAEAVAVDPSNREAWQRSAEVHALINQPNQSLRDLTIAVARGFEPRMARRDDELASIAKLPRFEEILKGAPGNARPTRGDRP